MVYAAGVMLVLFAVLLLRLWYLQVLEGDSYLAKANGNQVRDVKVAASRGQIVDRDGRVLVDSRPSNAIVVLPGRLPEAGTPEREATATRLSVALGMSTAKQPCRVAGKQVMITALGCRIEREAAALPYANIIIKRDASAAEAAWVLENRRDIPISPVLISLGSGCVITLRVLLVHSCLGRLAR